MLKEMQEICERTYDILNVVFYNGVLPKVIITIQSSPKTYGHFTTIPVWKSRTEYFHEINISAEHLDRDFQNIVATIAYEMCHLYAKMQGIADTSKDGKYHNKQFKEIAETHGIHVEYVKYIGYSKTFPSQQLLDVIKEYNLGKPLEINRSGFIEDNIEVTGTDTRNGSDNTTGLLNKTTKKKSSTRNWECPCCKNKVRSTKIVSIICGDCFIEFQLKEI